MASSSLCHCYFNPITVTPFPNTKLNHSSSQSSRRISLRVNRRSFSISATMSSSTKKVLIPVAHGTEPFEAVVMIDVLRRGGADVTVASVENQVGVDACHGIKIVADTLLSEITDSVFDLIMLPGGLPGGETLKNCKPLEKMVKKQDTDGRLNAAICCAPALALGTWGLLEGKKATCYPVFMEKLAACAKAVESRVEIDGKMVTSRGPGTTMEFSVTLVEQLLGKEKAVEVSGPLVMRPNPGDEYTITELNQVNWSFDGTPQILVPIADGSEEMEAVAIIDVLRRAKANVVVAALGNSLEVVASRKVKLVADVLLDEAEKNSYDLIVLPGGLGGAEAFASSEKLVNMLKKQAESNKPYGAICASPALVFEPHGLLKGKKATAFPAMCSKLTDQSHIEHRVLVDGNLITSRGPGTSLEFALAIVEKFYGREKGLQLAKATLV
ncbi:Class I glutamine amidotransferase-like [Arabidopsis suecica]|uniref:Class I glutamine amidotransferase-like n=1 Tax=Arabidopsis suecica TaxID=45249 RepID=A0A8T2D0E8_ARASU|nr:Class I glutamine amidotransferase-like [Arabidopsis suecica]